MNDKKMLILCLSSLFIAAVMVLPGEAAGAGLGGFKQDFTETETETNTASDQQDSKKKDDKQEPAETATDKSAQQSTSAEQDQQGKKQDVGSHGKRAGSFRRGNSVKNRPAGKP